MKITKEINKFKTDVTKAMNFMFPTEIPRSLLMNIASTPSRGVKSKDDNIYIKRILYKYLYFVWNDEVITQH